MGISWSSRRANSDYGTPQPFPLHPPPPQPPPHCYYPPGAIPLHPPFPYPPPPPLAPPHQRHPPLPSNLPPHGSYPTYPVPPLHATNHIAARFTYHPYYQASQPNGQTVVQPGGDSYFVNDPPPYIAHQNAKKIRNDINVHRETLKLEIDEHNPDHHLVSFIFDALFDGSITVFCFGKEEHDCQFLPLYPEVHLPTIVPIQKGIGQIFTQPTGTGIDLGFFNSDDLSKPSPTGDIFPLVIVAETHLSDRSSLRNDQCSSSSNANSHKQITQAVIEEKKDKCFHVKAVKQILCIDGVRYELHEIYGIGSSKVAGPEDGDHGKECVVCMTEPKDTTVLPCRHMCLCGSCAKALRLQSNKCPMCRQPIEELMEIRINGNPQ